MAHAHTTPFLRKGGRRIEPRAEEGPILARRLKVLVRLIHEALPTQQEKLSQSELLLICSSTCAPA